MEKFGINKGHIHKYIITVKKCKHHLDKEHVGARLSEPFFFIMDLSSNIVFILMTACHLYMVSQWVPLSIYFQYNLILGLTCGRALRLVIWCYYHTGGTYTEELDHVTSKLPRSQSPHPASCTVHLDSVSSSTKHSVTV